eukprot:11781774-Ditylum_brightwellii.AAC.1
MIDGMLYHPNQFILALQIPLHLLTLPPHQTLKDIVTCTETVEKAYQEDKAMLQQLYETSSALQNDTTVQDNFALLCEQTESISKKTDKLEAWTAQFDAAQEKHFKESEKKIKKRFEYQEESIDGKFKDMNTTMKKKPRVHYECH